MEMAWVVYILRCADGSYYVGYSHDVEERVKRHNDGVGAVHTRDRRPVVLIWTESAESELSARKRELQIKGWTRLKKENLMKYGHPKGMRNVE